MPRSHHDVFILAAPLSLGQKKRGVESAPKRLLQNENFQHWQSKYSSHILVDDIPAVAPKKTFVENYKLAGTAFRNIFEKIWMQAKQQKFCLTLGGDHSVAIGSVGAMLKLHSNLRVFWIDAHGDANTLETSPSGNLHGMPLAVLLGWLKDELPKEFQWLKHFLKPKNVALIGVRALDEKEKTLLDTAGIWYATAEDVKRLGMRKVTALALKHTNAKGFPTHISFDVDGLDPKFAPSTGTPEGKGLSLKECQICVETIAAQTNFVSMDVVEMNPRIKPLGAKTTLDSATQVIVSALAQRMNAHFFEKEAS